MKLRRKEILTPWTKDRWILLALAVVLIADIVCIWWKISQYSISVEKMIFMSDRMGTIILIEPK